MTTEVAVVVSACGRLRLRPFRFVAVPVGGRSGLWPFKFVAFSVCGRFGLWQFRFVAVLVVAVSVCGRYNLLPIYDLLQTAGYVLLLHWGHRILVLSYQYISVHRTNYVQNLKTFLENCKYCKYFYHYGHTTSWYVMNHGTLYSMCELLQ